MLKKTTEERFWSHVDKTNSCWNWTGHLNAKKRYGHIKINKKYFLVHRFSYELSKGKIPEGLTIDHLCRNTSCVNPDHLEAVTMKENLMRGIGACAINSRKTHCPQGHEYAEENICPSQIGRVCKICRREQALKYYYKNREMHIEYGKKHYQKNKEQIKQKSREKYAEKRRESRLTIK